MEYARGGEFVDIMLTMVRGEGGGEGKDVGGGHKAADYGSVKVRTRRSHYAL